MKVKRFQHVDIICFIPTENGIIALRKIIDPIRKDSQRVCIVVDDKKFTIALCVFPSVPKKMKNGKVRIFPIPRKAERVCIEVVEPTGRNPKKSSIKIKFTIAAVKEKKVAA